MYATGTEGGRVHATDPLTPTSHLLFSLLIGISPGSMWGYRLPPELTLGFPEVILDQLGSSDIPELSLG